MDKVLTEILANINCGGDREPPVLAAAERQALLDEFHPDNQSRGKETLSFGPNRGERVPGELTAAIAAEEIYPQEIATVKTGLLVIGSGAAGISAALEAAGRGIKVLLATRDQAGSSNTVLAQGGMAVAVGVGDSPALHAEDTVRGGRSNDHRLVEIMATEAQPVIRWLEEMGMIFDREADNRYRLLPGGGHSKNRVLTRGGFIGPRIMRVLLGAVKKSSVELRPFYRLVELISEGERCRGAVFFSSSEGRYIRVEGGAVILATGGSGGLKPFGLPTSNHKSIRGEGLSAAYRAGLKLLDMDASQFHPTGALWPEPVRGMLVSEGVRSLGAGLFNSLGRQFINPMETRDVVTAAIMAEVAGGRGIETPGGESGVLLNTGVLSERVLSKSLGKIYRKLQGSGYNPRATPLVVGPLYHYQNGGLEIDGHGRTDLAGLWAAGEVTGGIHGKNRLGGNALTDAFVFGRRAGRDAARFAAGGSR